MTLAPRPRSTSSRGAKPKNFLSFLFAAPPTPPAAKRKKEWKGNFWFCCRRFTPPKRLISHISIFASFTPAFSPSFASARGAPISASCGSSVVRSYFASTSHWPLTFVRDACSVLASCSLCGFGGVRGNSLCLPHPPSARTN